MNMTPRRATPPALLLTLFACLTLLPAHRAMAIRGQVVDGADFFKPETQDQAAGIIRDVKQRFGKDLMVETYPAIPAELEPAFRKKGRNSFYADWSDQRFRALGVNGVYILITKNPGRVEIAVGNLTQQQAFTLADRDELLAVMIEPFRAGKSDDALLAGLDFIEKRLERNTGAAAPAPQRPEMPPPGPGAAPVANPGPEPAPAPGREPPSVPPSVHPTEPTPAPQTLPEQPAAPSIHLPSVPETAPADSPAATTAPAKPTTDQSLRPLPDAERAPAGSTPTTGPTTAPMKGPATEPATRPAR